MAFFHCFLDIPLSGSPSLHGNEVLLRGQEKRGCVCVVAHLCEGAGLGAAEVTMEDGSSSDSRSVLSTLSSCDKTKQCDHVCRGNTHYIEFSLSRSGRPQL